MEEQKLDSLEKAKLNVVLAKATNVLYAVHLSTFFLPKKLLPPQVVFPSFLFFFKFNFRLNESSVPFRFWFLVGTRGVNTKGHPIEKELERIARFEEKIKRAVKESEASALAGEAALGFVADAPPKKDKKRDKAKRKRKQKE